MGRFFLTLARWSCRPLKYLCSVAFALFFGFGMTVYVVPLCVSLLIASLGFTDDATTLVIAFMGGVPAVFMAGLLLYFTIAAIRFVHRRVFDYFDKSAARFASVLSSDGDGDSTDVVVSDKSDKPKKGFQFKKSKKPSK